MEYLDNLFKILFVVLFFGLSVFFHELGHLLVAKWRGMHADKFSIGFGKPIWQFRKWDIDFIIGWLPFGGFVALPQMDSTNENEPETADGQQLPYAKPLDRILVALAGPAANILFALFLGIFIWQFGAPVSLSSDRFVVDEIKVSSPEYLAGLRSGDHITAINGHKFKNELKLKEELAFSHQVTYSVKRNGKEITIGPFSPYKDPLIDNLPAQQFSFAFDIEPIIKNIIPDFPAEKAGLKPGDKITAVNDQKYDSIYDVNKAIKRQQGKEMKITLLRKGEEKSFILRTQANKLFGLVIENYPYILDNYLSYPAQNIPFQKGDKLLSVNNKTFKNTEELVKYRDSLKDPNVLVVVERNGKKFELEYYAAKNLIGIQWNTKIIGYPTPWEQVEGHATSTANTIIALVKKDSPVGLKHMSSVVGMSNGIYRIVSQMGYMAGLNFIIVINVSLAIFNLLPIPVLDGGHITFAGLESIARRRLSPLIMQKLSFVFVLALISLMLFATMNDIRRVRKTAPTLVQKTNPLISHA